MKTMFHTEFFTGGGNRKGFFTGGGIIWGF